MQVEYRRELNHSYMTVRNRNQELIGQYTYRMITKNQIRRLLVCQERQVDGESWLYFEISSRQPLERLYEGRRMDAEDIGNILRAILQTQEDLGEYMLDGEGLWLEPAAVFADVETEELYFGFYPGWNQTQNQYMALADFFLEHVDHGKENAVNLAYQFYKMSKTEYFVLSSFLPYVEKECSMGKHESETDAGVWINPGDRKGAESRSFTEPDENTDFWEDDVPKQTEAAKENQPKKGWFARLFGKRFSQKEQNRQRHQKEPVSLWDQYAERLEQHETGETVYFSNLEKTVPSPAGRPYLVEMEGSRKFSLEVLPVTVGKLAQRAEIVLEDASISRIHARFFSEAQDLWVMDLNSKNGSILNGRRLMPNEAVKVENGDEVCFGRERFQIAFIDSKDE